ncbi:MAG: MipA/OmpV family protein [Pseudomonadota bacterium]|nr:MipA/OmpV family protein [Pseudomonadota bacterium]
MTPTPAADRSRAAEAPPRVRGPVPPARPAACAAGLLLLAAVAEPAAAQDSDLLRQMLDTLNFDAVAEGWEVTLGAGASVAPEYEGADDLAFRPAPVVEIEWRDRAFLNVQRGLGVHLLDGPQWRLGTSLGFAPGRDEDDSDRLTGLGDVDPAAQAQLFGAWRVGRLGLSLDLKQDLGGSDGTLIEPGLSYVQPLARGLTLAAGGSAPRAGDAHMQAYFGVSGAQSRRSGLAPFSAGAGFKRVDATLAVNWAFAETWSARAFVGVGRLLGDAADSPVTQEATQPSAGLFLAHAF